MPSKESVLLGLKDKGYSFAEVKHLIGTITCVENYAPSEFRKGDVFIQKVGVKSRPVVIICVEEDIVYGIPLSTTEDELNLCESKSRFFGESFFSNQLISASHEYVRGNFAGIYDNPKVVNNAIRELKKITEKVLVIKK